MKKWIAQFAMMVAAVFGALVMYQYWQRAERDAAIAKIQAANEKWEADQRRQAVESAERQKKDWDDHLKSLPPSRSPFPFAQDKK